MCSWTPSANNGAGTSYEQSDDAGNTVKSIEVGEGYDKKLKAGKAVTWCVRATNNTGTSEWACDTVARPPKQDDDDDDDDDDDRPAHDPAPPGTGALRSLRTLGRE